MSADADVFFLYDLKVEVVVGRKPMICSHRVGDYFTVSGENLTLPSGQSFSIYALAALLPLIPAKQRELQANDWMSVDWEIACPDPNCGARFKISRLPKRSFRLSEVTLINQ